MSDIIDISVKPYAGSNADVTYHLITLNNRLADHYHIIGTYIRDITDISTQATIQLENHDSEGARKSYDKLKNVLSCLDDELTDISISRKMYSHYIDNGLLPNIAHCY